MAPREGDVFAMAEEEANSISSGGSGLLGQVWIGNEAKPFIGPVIDESKRPQTTKKFISGDKIVGLMQQWYANGNSEYGKVRNNLLKAGLLAPGWADYTPSVLEKTSEAVALWMRSDKSKPFGEWLDGLGQSGGGDKSGRGGGYNGPTTRTSVSISDETEASMMLNELARKQLGRSYTSQELEKATDAFRKGQASNPTVTVNTPNGRAASSSVTQAGMSSEAIAQQIIESDPAFADQVIRTDVLDMFMSRIDGKLGTNG